MKSSLSIFALTLALMFGGSLRAQEAGQASFAHVGEEGSPVFLSSDEIFSQQASYGTAFIGEESPHDDGGKGAKGGKGGKGSLIDTDCFCPQCRNGVLRFTWGSFDFLHAWTKGSSVPVLVSTSPAGTDPDDAGVFPPAGPASTTALFGGERIGDDRQSGGRMDIGLWLSHGNGIGLRLFALEGDRTAFNAGGSAEPILANPFFSVDLGQNDSFLINVNNTAGPGFFRGRVDITTNNDVLFGDAYLRMCMASGAAYKIDFLGGYQMGRVDDAVNMRSFREVIVDPDGFLPPGTTQETMDSFSTQNEFHMLSLGVDALFRHNCYSLKALAKMSVGNVNQRVSIAGTSALNGGTPSNQGLFARNSNSGEYSDDRFTYIPEVGFTLGWDVTNCLQLTAGYTFMYMPHVALAGDQIDTRIDILGGTAPTFTLRETDFWVQGVNLGFSWVY